MEIIRTDVLVIGGGQAALCAAIAAKESGADVLIVTKGKAGMGGSSVISDGVHSAILSPKDSTEVFFQDMIKGGRHISDHVRARILAEECTERVLELESKFKLKMEYEKKVATPGHSFPRRCYVEGGIGKGITKALGQYAKDIGIRVCEKTDIFDLINKNGTIYGAVGKSKDNQLVYFVSSSTILATGGIGGLYAHSDNPNDVTGEGISMAWRHGVSLIDMEFIQFYPYRLVSPKNVDVFTKIFGYGAKMKNEKGEHFMESFPRGELETRDRLSYEMFKQGEVYLDLEDVSLDDIKQMSSHVYQIISKGYSGNLVMSPVEHYSIGGIKVDEHGFTGVPGLFACGECTGGLHGANRLGGGSLTEALVFGERAGKRASANLRNTQIEDREIMHVSHMNDSPIDSKMSSQIIRNQIQELMWNKVGIERTNKSLLSAKQQLERLQLQIEEEGMFHGIQKLKVLDMIRAAWFVSFSALTRKESRGAHIVKDYAKESKDWEGNIEINGQTWSFKSQKSTHIGGKIEI